MASNHKGEEPVGWVTVKGVHFPKWKDGTIGWQDGEEHIDSKTTTKETKKNSDIAKRIAKGDYYKETGKTAQELRDNLAKNGLALDSADYHSIEASRHFNDEKVTLYDKDENEYEATYNRYSDGGRELMYIKPKQKATTQFGEQMNEEINNYQSKFLTKRSDKEIAELKKNLETSGKIAGTTKGDQVALAAIEREQKSRTDVKATEAILSKEAAQGVGRLKEKYSKKNWENGYHVEHTDSVGGKFVDKGKVGDYEIGEKVNYLSGDKMKSGTINKAHIYPNGKVDYNVVDADGDGHNVSTKNLAKTNSNKFKNTSTSKAVKSHLETAKKMEVKLKEEFKKDRNTQYVMKQANPATGITTEYVVSTGLDGKGIQMYKREYDSKHPNKSFGGGVTLAKGYFDVAQYMEDKKFTKVVKEESKPISKNAKYDTSRAKKKKK